jgi:integrase
VRLVRAQCGYLHIGKTKPVTANRLLALIGATYSYGLRSGRLPERLTNPASGIERFREQIRERFLSESELYRLGEAIREAETVGIPWIKQSKSKHARKRENRITNIGPHAAAALRLLIFTGARLREILELRWDHVDLQRGLLFLPDSKTGKKTIVLGAAALAVLENLPRIGNFVIAGADNERPRADLQRPWALASDFMTYDIPSRASVLASDLGFPSLASCSGIQIPKLPSDTLISQQTHYGVRPMR